MFNHRNFFVVWPNIIIIIIKLITSFVTDDSHLPGKLHIQKEGIKYTMKTEENKVSFRVLYIRVDVTCQN